MRTTSFFALSCLLILVSGVLVEYEPESPIQVGVVTGGLLINASDVSGLVAGTEIQWTCDCGTAFEEVGVSKVSPSGNIFFSGASIPVNMTCKTPNLTVAYEADGVHGRVILHTKEYYLLGVVVLDNDDGIDVGILVVTCLLVVGMILIVTCHCKKEISRGTIFYAKVGDLTYDDIYSSSDCDSQQSDDNGRNSNRDNTHFHPRPEPDSTLDLSAPLLDEDIFDGL
eukprot:TRINITY_DN24923_c0_g1_i1.p1 TRINITY_DN24923_c0_g1~~TRINITY_DN24923_c0_g1_i1.p1  ORF type:complete len:226 (+),score=31.99 TRINITY_DN24923_c0_g1_i1:42-719(+)